MSKRTILRAFGRYKSAPPKGALRRRYLSDFEPKMIYRTTKTENPSTRFITVKNVLARFRREV